MLSRRTWPTAGTAVLALLLSGLAAGPAAGAVAADPSSTTLSLATVDSAVEGQTLPVTVTLDAPGAPEQPLTGERVVLERQDPGGSAWVPIGTLTTGSAGTASGTVPFEATTTLRATYAGESHLSPSESGPHPVTATTTSGALTLAAPARAYVDDPAHLVATLALPAGSAVSGRTVRLQHREDGAWVEAATAPTEADGTAGFDVDVAPADRDNSYRVLWDGDQATGFALSTAHRIESRKRATRLRITGTHHFVDETSTTLELIWATRDGRAVSGPIRLQRRTGGKWRRVERIRVRDGHAEVVVSPRVDTRWLAVGGAGRWWKSDTSDVFRLDNRPPGEPVVLPRKAPRPTVHVPRPARAVGPGAHARVTRIPARIWRQMTGRTWHRGCPVGRASLRLLRINFWGYDGYRYRGELVVRSDVTGKFVKAFSAMYRGRFPLRSMYREDRFGWSDRVRGADDYKSMRAGNSSAFNCRDVVGNPGTRSPHSYGRAVDVNTWENPYRSAQGTVPNTWWQGHSHPRVAWRSSSHPVVRIFQRAGFRWTYGLGDTQHFDATSGSARYSAREWSRSSATPMD